MNRFMTFPPVLAEIIPRYNRCLYPTKGYRQKKCKARQAKMLMLSLNRDNNTASHRLYESLFPYVCLCIHKGWSTLSIFEHCTCSCNNSYRIYPQLYEHNTRHYLPTCLSNTKTTKYFCCIWDNCKSQQKPRRRTYCPEGTATESMKAVSSSSFSPPSFFSR